MTDEQTKQAILGFTEFFKGITGNQNLEIPSEIAERFGIQAQADGEYINKTESLKALDTFDKFGYYNHDMFRLDKDSEKDYVAYIRYDDAVKCINGMPSVAIPSAEPYKGMTNFEVIQMLFPNPDKIDGEFRFTKEWGDSLYSEGSEK